MPFPKQQRFTIPDLALHWNKSESYIAELVRNEQFPYIIVQGEILGGVPVTRHIFYDREFLRRKGGDFRKPLTPHERDELLKYNQFSFSSGEFINVCEPNPENEDWLDSLPSSYNALEQGTIYIPAISVKYFEQKYGIRREADPQKVENKDKSPVPGPSTIELNKFYRTSQVARFLGVSQKHVQNIVVHQLPGKKVRGQWLVQGKDILAHMEQYPPIR